MHTTRQVLLRIAAIITVVELVIMLVLALVPTRAHVLLVAVVDVFCLVVLSTPLIYLWVVRPFVMARDAALAQINHLAHIDPLTQLANRRFLSKCLQKDIAGSNRHKCHVAVLIVDLDGFKQVNDAHGHDTGDVVLVAIARRLETITRAEDVVGRLGGDEFVVLLNQLDANELLARDQAMRVAEKIINLLNAPIGYNGLTLQVGASIGIRVIGCDLVEPDTVLSEADAALYHAKQAGKGCAVFYPE